MLLFEGSVADLIDVEREGRGETGGESNEDGGAGWVLELRSVPRSFDDSATGSLPSAIEEKKNEKNAQKKKKEKNILKLITSLLR